MRRASLLMALAALFVAGCELNLKPGAESILEALDTSRSPAELAQMAIDKYDPNARYIGTLGLANEPFANEPVYIRLFTDNLKDPEPVVRAAAARGLGNHGQPEHALLLVETLKDPDKLVRLESARALQRLHNPGAITPLITATRAPDPRSPQPSEADGSVRAEAAFALGQYAEVPVLQALVACLDDRELAVNNAALESLRTLTGQDLGLDRTMWAAWLKDNKDPFAARGMYRYPVFYRDLKWYEHIPFVPKPANEIPGAPAGMPRG
jgi:hypothetical protein